MLHGNSEFLLQTEGMTIVHGIRKHTAAYSTMHAQICSNMAIWLLHKQGAISARVQPARVVFS